MMVHLCKGTLLGAAMAMVALAGCRDLGPEPQPVARIYSLATIAGEPLPRMLRDPGSEGDFVTVRSGRVVLGAGSLEFHTTARIARRDGSGAESVVAEGESSQGYYFDRTDGRILPYRLEGGVRTEAPFFFEIQGASLVMHSSQDALRYWRFTS